MLLSIRGVKIVNMDEAGTESTDTKMSGQTSVDSCRFLIENLPTLVRLLPQSREIRRSIKNREKRSLGDDVLAINEKFRTDVEIQGVDNIPEEGGVVLAISHVSSTASFPGWKNRKANPLWWAAGATNALRERRGKETDFRPVIYASVGSKFDKSWRELAKVYGGFSVNSLAPKEALKSLRGAGESLKSGDVVLMSPEGDTHTQLIQAKRGIGKLAKYAPLGCPFVPVAFVENQNESGEYVYEAKFGKPVFLESEEISGTTKVGEVKRREIAFADRVMRRIAELMPKDARGVYS